VVEADPALAVARTDDDRLKEFHRTTPRGDHVTLGRSCSSSGPGPNSRSAGWTQITGAFRPWNHIRLRVRKASDPGRRDVTRSYAPRTTNDASLAARLAPETRSSGEAASPCQPLASVAAGGPIPHGAVFLRGNSNDEALRHFERALALLCAVSGGSRTGVIRCPTRRRGLLVANSSFDL
jgi:hypothetical protein